MNTKQNILKTAQRPSGSWRMLGGQTASSRLHPEAAALPAEGSFYPADERCVVGITDVSCDRRGKGQLGLAAMQPGSAILA